MGWFYEDMDIVMVCLVACQEIFVRDKCPKIFWPKERC